MPPEKPIQWLQDCDIVIVGGGLAGNSAAMALSGLGFRLGLVDNHAQRKPLDFPPKSLPSKALALSHSTVQFFKTMDLWPQIAPWATPIQAVHVSKQGRFGRTLLEAAPPSLPAFGFVVDSLHLEETLLKHVKTLPDLRLFSGITIHKHRDLRNPLVIGADGTHSRLRLEAGIMVRQHDYQQTAIVAHVDLKNDHHGVAYERFSDTGPIAMLPLPGRRVKCVWIVPNTQASLLCALSDTDFLQTLTVAFGHRLGPFLKLGSRNTYPLMSRIADSVYAERLVLLGNAAATLHPIAAQGFNLAVRDIAGLAEILLQAKNTGQALGDLSVLRAYAAQREPDRHNIISLTHRLAQGFETGAPAFPLATLRQLGLVLCDLVPSLKHWIIKQGTGFGQALPKLCRGVPLCSP